MKQVTHQCIAVGLAVALDAPIPVIAGVCLGAILPDMMDRAVAAISPDRESTFARIHRCSSHWFGWYVISVILLVMAPVLLPPILRPCSLAIQAVGSGIIYGALSHIALDMLTPLGVPLRPFSKQPRFTLSLFPTGSIQEKVFLGMWVLIIIALISYQQPELLRTLQYYLPSF